MSFTYDDNRNLAFDGTNTLTYDVENRLIQAQTQIWGTAQYLYDPLGSRKQKQVGAVVTQFLTPGGEEIADYNCYNTTCAPWVLTVRGPGGLPVAAITPATGSQAEIVVFYHHDIMGSTVASTTSGLSGPAEAYVYSDFDAPAGGSSLAYQFAGYHYDAETGLYYVNARYYNPNLGHSLQTDPIGTRGGNNLYAYVNNDPINLFDPTGLSQEEMANDSDASGSNALPSLNTLASGLRLVPTKDYSPGEGVADRSIEYQIQNLDGSRYTGTPLWVSEQITVVSGNPPGGTVPIGTGQWTSTSLSDVFQADSWSDSLGNQLSTQSAQYNQSFIVSQTPGLNPASSAPLLVHYSGGTFSY